MIKLKVEDYCSNCDEFEPTSVVVTNTYNDYLHCKTVVERNTTVMCEHRERCRCIHEYIKEKVK